jgi:hypothetical protein
MPRRCRLQRRCADPSAAAASGRQRAAGCGSVGPTRWPCRDAVDLKIAALTRARRRLRAASERPGADPSGRLDGRAAPAAAGAAALESQREHANPCPGPDDSGDFQHAARGRRGHDPADHRSLSGREQRAELPDLAAGLLGRPRRQLALGPRAGQRLRQDLGELARPGPGSRAGIARIAMISYLSTVRRYESAMIPLVPLLTARDPRRCGQAPAVSLIVAASRSAFVVIGGCSLRHRELADRVGRPGRAAGPVFRWIVLHDVELYSAPLTFLRRNVARHLRVHC